MSKKKFGSKAKRGKGSGQKRGHFAGHKMVGKKIVPELQFPTPLTFIQWDRDLLPEHLWIAALYRAYSLNEVIQLFHDLAEAIDEVWEDDYPFNGLISDFKYFPNAKRQDFFSNNRDIIQRAFVEPIGYGLALYPDNPASWLCELAIKAGHQRVEPDKEIGRVRKIVVTLLPGKDEHAGFIRALPLSRVMKAGKLHFPQSFDLEEVMVKYPMNCTEDEKRKVESFARTAMNNILHMMDRYKNEDCSWAKYFWRKNFDLTICREAHAPLPASQATDNAEDKLKPFFDSIESNISSANAYLNQINRQLRYDLYEPLKDEIFAGLMARALRLYVILLSNDALWARDTTGIFLRCLVDLLILFGYLARKNDPEVFEKYRKHSEGEEKLVRLHLQEYYSDETSLDGETAKELMEKMGIEGQFSEINLGSWSDKNTRQMAFEAGLEKPYRLIFKPASSDVHGGWMSLKRSSLAYCAEPLHRFHRLPSTFEPPLYINTLQGAHMLIVQCIDIAVSELDYPKPEQPFHDIFWPK